MIDFGLINHILVCLVNWLISEMFRTELFKTMFKMFKTFFLVKLKPVVSHLFRDNFKFMSFQRYESCLRT